MANKLPRPTQVASTRRTCNVLTGKTSDPAAAIRRYRYLDVDDETSIETAASRF